MDWTGDRAAFTLDRYTRLSDEQLQASAVSVAGWLGEATNAIALVVAH